MNCTFINNKADCGGAMYYGNAENCTFNSNSALNYGGAMYGVSAVNCAFDSNSALHGGAMDRGSAKNCTFNSNSAISYGGAMYYGNAKNCTFNSNSAISYGGAMYYGNAENCTFKNNKANNTGGAISATGYVATKCQFINNTAKNGGAIYLMTANECNFTQNTATEYGGAMYGGANNTCIFNHNKAGVSGDDTYHEKAILIVNNFTSTYNSGDKLLFNFTTTEGLPIDDARITIRLYRNNTLVYNNLYALSGEGWVVNVVAGFYNAVYSVENQVYQVNPVNATLKIDKANSTLTIRYYI